VGIQKVAEAEVDEMWSFVGNKKVPRWLWHAIDHCTGAVLAYVFGRRKDEVFLELKRLLEPFGITRYYTDYWGAYERHLAPGGHCPGKRNTQTIERTHLTLRTRIKRLVRNVSLKCGTSWASHSRTASCVKTRPRSKNISGRSGRLNL
jgi:insertion element IS1 protein InsB